MPPIDPSSSKCYSLDMPNPDSTDPRLRLDARTGASRLLEKSRILVHGGLITPLKLTPYYTISEIKTKMKDYVMDLPPNERKSNSVDYISNEVFSLSLVDRNWMQVPISENSEGPIPRFFHAMSVYDSFIYISGGLTFIDNHFNIEVLNDSWQFDMITKTWKCINEQGNNQCVARFDHKIIVTPDLIILGKNNHHGLLYLGGIDQNDKYVKTIDVLDLIDFCWVGIPLDAVKTSRIENSVVVPDNFDSNLRASISDLGVYNYKEHLSLMVYSKPDSKYMEPLLDFDNEKLQGVRLVSNRQYIKKEKDLKNYPYELHYPTIGFFGENIIITGFIPGELTISAYLLNKSTGKWVRLQIYCSHNVWSHRFCKGFVWASHHKVIFLGNNDTSQTPPSCQYFNIYISVSLPFTNTMGADMTYNKAPAQSTDTSMGSIPPVPSASASASVSAQNPARGGSITSISPQGAHSTNSPHTSFAAYSHYVAPQIQINSVRSVFPPYAVALGKNAFERSSSLSDVELVSYEGVSIKLPISLLRARWGRRFEEMLAMAYAMAFIDSEANPETPFHDEPTRLNSAATNYSKDDNSSTSSVKKKNDETPPLFRYPFQDKSSSSQNVSSSGNKDSPVNSSSRLGSPGLVARHHSIGGSKVDSAISLSRRSSFNAPTQSRQNSVATTSSRRSSSYSQSASRRGSLISKQSSSTQSQQSQQSLTQQQQPQLQPPPQQHLGSSPISSFSNYQMSRLGGTTASQSLPDISIAPSSDIPSNSSSVSTNFEPEIYVTELPERPPMPEIEPVEIGKLSTVPSAESLIHRTPTTPSISLDDDLRPPTSPSTPSMLTTKLQQQTQSSNRPSVSSTTSSYLSPSSANKHGSGSSSTNAYIASRMQQLGLSPSGSPRSSISGSPGAIQPMSELRSMPMESQNDDSSEKNLNIPFYEGGDSGSSVNDGLGSSFGSPEQQFNLKKHSKGASLSYSNIQLDVCRIPRVFAMPYATETVKAVASFLYTGQVGSNWKIFPTATEVMLIAKFYEIPLLYDLILEVLYAVVAKKEFQLIERGRKLKDKCIKNEIHFNSKSRFSDGVSGIAAIDQFDSYLSKMDDGLLDLTLLKRASKIASRTSRTLEGKSKSKSKDKNNKKDEHDDQEDDDDEYPSISKMNVGSVSNTSVELRSLSGDSDSSKTSDSASLKDTIGLIDSSRYDLSQGYGVSTDSEQEDQDGKKTNVLPAAPKESTEAKKEKKGTDLGEYDDKAMDWPTFKDLTDPNAPACPDILIDMLVEVGALNSDLKLLLRVMNAREMASQLRKEEKHFNAVLAARAGEPHSSKLNPSPSHDKTRKPKAPPAQSSGLPHPPTLDPASGYRKDASSASPLKAGCATEIGPTTNIPPPFKSSYATDIVPPTPTTSDNPVTPVTPTPSGIDSSSTAPTTADALQGFQPLQPPGIIGSSGNLQQQTSSASSSSTPGLKPSITPVGTPPLSHSMTHLTFTKLENAPTSHVYHNHPPSIPTPPTPNNQKQQVSLPPNPSQLQQQYPSSVQHFSSSQSPQQQLQQQQLLRSSSSNISTLSNNSSASTSLVSGVSGNGSGGSKKKTGVGKLFSRLKSSNH